MQAAFFAADRELAMAARFAHSHPALFVFALEAARQADVHSRPVEERLETETPAQSGGIGPLWLMCPPLLERFATPSRRSLLRHPRPHRYSLPTLPGQRQLASLRLGGTKDISVQPH